MSKMYRLDGNFVEVTDEELLLAVKADDKKYPTDLLSQIVNSCLMNVCVYSRASFDNAKDTNQMIAAANENQEVLRKLLEYQMHIRLEELVQEKLSAPKKGNSK